MAAGPLLYALPGLLVGAGCSLLSFEAYRQGRRWSAALLVGLAVFAFLGWGVRPFLTDPSIALTVGVMLLAWETLLHGILMGFVARLVSKKVRWLCSLTGALLTGSVIVGFAVAVVLVPSAFIGRVGELDGIPGLYRLDAGFLAVPWAGLMVAIRAVALWAAVDAHRHATDAVHARQMR